LPDTNAERIRLLSMVDIFESLTVEEIESLNGQLPDRRLKKGEIFFGPGPLGEALPSAEWQGQDLQDNPRWT
jgi:hypothetical protein